MQALNYNKPRSNRRSLVAALRRDDNSVGDKTYFPADANARTSKSTTDVMDVLNIQQSTCDRLPLPCYCRIGMPAMRLFHSAGPVS